MVKRREIAVASFVDRPRLVDRREHPFDVLRRLAVLADACGSLDRSACQIKRLVR